MNTIHVRAFRFGWLISAALIVLPNNGLYAKRIMPPAGAGTVNLPHLVADDSGTQWHFYQGGWFQQQGNRPTFGQAAMLTINNNGPQVNVNTAQVDAKTGEIVFANMNTAGFPVTRRVAIDKETHVVRYVDIISNPQAQEQTIEFKLQSNVNFGISAGEIVDDPKRKGQKLAWVVQTQGGGGAAELYAGRGSKVPAEITWQVGNNQVQVVYRLAIPARSDVAVVHFHASVDSQAKGIDWVSSIKEARAFADLPRDIRSLIVNFPGGQSFIGTHEILRGDNNSDIVELRGGDQLKGALKPDVYALRTFYGQVEIPAERVVALLNVGEFRPRQLLVTVEGEIFGGYLAKDTIELQLSTGQVTQVPVAQIVRAGYRKRLNEPEEWTFDKPLVVLRSGDRMFVEPPAGPIEVMTRYGLLKLPPSAVSAVLFQSEALEQGIHEIRLTDGSRVAGLATSTQFDLKLATKSNAKAQTVKIGAGDMSRLQLSPSGESNIEPADNAPTLQLAGGDLLVGTIEGTLKLDTAFDTLTINAAEVRKLTSRGQASEESGSAGRSSDETFGNDIQLTLWDNSIVRGQLSESTVQCKLQSGPVVSIPVPLIVVYEQPEPKASAGMMEQVKATVVRLNADDWRERDRAQQELIEQGDVIVPILRELRPAQPPEAQQRIDQVFAKIGASATSSPSPAAAPVVVDGILRE